MPLENIRHVLVWSPWLRLSHWLIAAGLVFQVVSAWTLGHDNANNTFWLDWHIISGQIMLIALLLRVVLLFLPGSSNWRAFFPTKAQRLAMLQMMKFYLSFTRYPLPNWHAHNPLWLPLYFLMFLILAATLVSGLFYNSPYTIVGYPIQSVHRVLANLIVIFSILHIVSVLLHELKGKGAFISAMINGYRYFHFTKQNNGLNIPFQKNKSTQKSVSISADSIKKRTNHNQNDSS